MRFLLLLLPIPVLSQVLSTNTPVPPLQWLNITNLLQGTPAPPLKYPSIGYDDSSRNLVIFGGESSSGILTSQTFLFVPLSPFFPTELTFSPSIDFNSNKWSLPNPEPDLPSTPPPARYMAIGGDDFSSSYRQAHLIIGGRGSNGSALNDAWEYDYVNQFWSRVTITPGSPPPRWSASGGRDYRTPADTATTNTTFYMVGGTDGDSLFPLNEVWEFEITGSLSANLAENSTLGSWSNQTVGTKPGASVNQASTCSGNHLGLRQRIDICADTNSYVVNAGSSTSEITPPPCPVPRYGGTMAFNPSSASSSFGSQVFLILGTFNSSYWDDQGGLQRGEVAVLDTTTGTWSRVLPAGDPGTSGVPTFPTPREGAVAYSFGEALVGNNRQGAADTIVFGGQDEHGTYLNEVWILRAYNGVITSSGQTLEGSSGQLQTGLNANGTGVTVQYMTQCASQLTSVPTPTSSPGAPSSTATSGTTHSSESFNVSFVHKLTAPLSIALLFPAILVARLALPPANVTHQTNRRNPAFYLASVIAILAYGLGVAGLVTSFTSIRSTVGVTKRSATSLILRTPHGIAGLILVIALYVVVPLLFLFLFFRPVQRLPGKEVERSEAAADRSNSADTAEKLGSNPAPRQTQYPPSPPASPRVRLHSWGGSSFWLGRRSREGRTSIDSESMHSSGPQRAFEVVNRPARVRRASINGLAYPNIEVYQRVPVVPRSLGDVDWLDRRRSLNAVNELDYHVNHGRTHGHSNVSTPNTAEMLSTRALVPTAVFPRTMYEIPPPFELSLRIFFHMLILALCVLSLVALWYRAPMSLFAVFLLWTVIFYVCLFALAWHGRPGKSFLSTLAARMRGPLPQPTVSPGTPTSRPLSMTGTDQYPFPTDTRGPYLHQPTYRPAGHDDVSTSQGPRSVETDEDDDDIDEDTRQRRIEEEMGRREVSVVTVPKRRLWITNPS
ncbi:hypothetical protein JVU11DRAFT_1501 [Chiua virens]|nr:hypothetical protein JVU11DRAFT_1501 [Chiua virens]